MTLRTLGDHPRRSARRPSGLRLLGACATLVVVLLGLYAGSSGADVSSYTGTLYLTKTASGIGTGNWQLATSAPSSVDNTTQNRVAFSPATTGYALFAPGVNPGLGNTSAPSSISVSTCTGWVVDGTGGMTFPAASWTFQATVEDPLSANGQAKLTAALYKADASGNVVATIVSPTDGAANLIRSSGATTTTVSISAAAASFSLSSNQHLCLMFWRHQTTTYTSGGAATRLFKLDVNDGTASITSHPVPDAFPTVTLASTPADGSYVIAGQTLTLGATYSDPESEAGTVVIQVCPDSACSSITTSNTFNAVSSGSSVTWSPSLADGTWYWRASGTDSAGGQSWSATHSFTLDTTVPSAPALVSPNDGVTTNNLALTATFSDPSVSDTGTLEFRICSDSLCASPVTTSPPTSTLANNANSTWTISPAPPDGTYYWEALAQDTAGNQSSWSAPRAVTFDRTPPVTTITSNPPALSTSSTANFSFSADDPTATFECNLDSAGWGTSCTSPKSYSGLADGSHTLQVRGTDPIGNVGTAASYTWSIDTTVPSSPALSAPADGALVNAIPQLGGSFADPTGGDTGKVDFRICTSAATAGTACSGLVQSGSSSTVTSGSIGTYTPSGLADSTYDWQARGQDTAGNQSGWTATRSFTLDTTPPETSIGPTEPTSDTNSTSASFDFSATESGSTFKCSLDGAAFTSCTSPQSYASLTEGSHTFAVEATDPAGNTDPTPASYTWTVDLTPPDTSITSQPPNPSNNTTPSFQFTSTESGSTFQCQIDAGLWSSCTSPHTLSPALDEGSHTFAVRATDPAGNTDATPASYTWTVDLTPPNTSITSEPPNPSNNTTPSFQFSSTESGSTFECRIDGGSWSSCSSPDTLSPALGDGSHTFDVRATDPAGNTDSTPAGFTWTVDTTPPDTSITAHPNDPSNNTGPSFQFSSTEAGSTFTCSLDGAPFTSCTSPQGYSSLSQGSHTFSVEATDVVGNTDATPATYTWTVDTTPPDTSIGPTQPPAVSTSSAATFDFSATEPSTFECSRDGSAWAACTSPKTYSGLTESSHTFQVRATDLAGNVDATPASYSWYVDTSVPPTPGLVAPTAGFATNTLPQLRATFTDPNSSDSGTVEFRICSAAASAGTACSPMVDDVSSAVVASGATASYTPSSLTNGVFYWQALAQDSAGNQSAWTATRSFIYDTNIPDVPVLQSPDNGGWVRSVKLTAKFNEPAFAGTGSIEFRICSDALCLAVSASGMTGTVPNGTFAGWEAPHLLDGYWWWQARAHDAAGNVSAWSSIDGFHLDATPPAAPTHFNGTIGANGLTLRWNPPIDTIANFVVYVNGNSGPYLGGVTYEYNVGAFDAGDTRTFSVRAVDRAGNFGAMSTVLVGVPNLVGLTLGQAENATQSRGLVLRRASSLMQALPTIVVSQDPAPGSVESLGSAVKVVLKEVPSGQVPFTVQVLPVRVACAAGSILRVHLQLSLLARVRAQVVGRDGRVLATRVLGRVLPGDAVVRVRLPKSSSGVAKVVFVATSSDGRTGHVVVRVVGGKRGCHALHRRPH